MASPATATPSTSAHETETDIGIIRVHHVNF